MTIIQIISLSLLAVFYAVYLGKKLAQRRQGIRTDVLGSAGKPRKERLIETALKVMTYGTVAVEVASVIWGHSFLPEACAWAGLAVTAAGVLENSDSEQENSIRIFVEENTADFGQGRCGLQ